MAIKIRRCVNLYKQDCNMIVHIFNHNKSAGQHDIKHLTFFCILQLKAHYSLQHIENQIFIMNANLGKTTLCLLVKTTHQ